jgi:TRAP-type mannitol/chloroaromatic compound transport system permease small subunit
MSDDVSHNNNNVETPGAPTSLGAPDRILGWVLIAFNAVGTTIILFLTIVTDTEVISRKLADIPGLNDLAVAFQRWLYDMPNLADRDAFQFGPIEGVLELSELAIVVIVFLQLGYATRAGKMVRSDGLLSILQKRAPSIGHLLGLFFNLVSAAFFCAILWGGWDIFHESVTEGHWAGTQGLFSVPTWPAKLVVLLGSAGVALQFLVFAIQHGRALLPGDRAPVS